MAEKDSHGTSSGEHHNRGLQSIRHHCGMKCKHFTCMVLSKSTRFNMQQCISSAIYIKYSILIGAESCKNGEVTAWIWTYLECFA